MLNELERQMCHSVYEVSQKHTVRPCQKTDGQMDR